MSEIAQLFLVSSIGSFVALAGGLVFLYSKKLSDLLATNSIPFAAGVLITVALVGLLPEAAEAIGTDAFIIVLLSFIAAYLFEHLFFGIHHHDENCKNEHHSEKHVHYGASIPFVIFGDSIHNFIDGIAIGASFIISPGLGLVTAISTLLHEVPHEIGDFGIMLKHGWSKTKIIFVNILSASLTLIGAFLVYSLPVSDNLIGSLMAISAGIFLYLGATDFLPHIDTANKNKFSTLIPLILGVLIMLGTLLLVPHSQETESSNVERIRIDIEHKAES